MYKINEKLAVHGFDFNPETYELASSFEYKEYFYGYISDKKFLKTGQYLNGYKIIDCRDIPDDPGLDSNKYRNYNNKSYKYKRKISKAVEYIKNGENVVCCCSAGQSRSSAIALGILIEYFDMDFYDAWKLIRAKNPLCNIAMQHLDAIKSIYGVKLP